MTDLFKQFMDPGETDINNARFPKAFVERMLETERRLALESGHKQEREELVCRLLASGMPVDEVSLVLKIRTEDISDIAKYNGDKIMEYTKTLKSRRKSRERRSVGL